MLRDCCDTYKCNVYGCVKIDNDDNKNRSSSALSAEQKIKAVYSDCPNLIFPDKNKNLKGPYLAFFDGIKIIAWWSDILLLTISCVPDSM